MNCPLTGEEEGLVGFWDFNEGIGNTVYDLSGNENHGIINGGPTYIEDFPEQNCNILDDSINTGVTFLGSFDGSDYYISQNQFNWETSNEFSNYLGGTLSCVTSESENNFIVELIDSLPIFRLWLGGIYDMSNSSFTWLTGEDFNYENWHNSEPSSPGDENYLNMWGSLADTDELGEWNDEDNIDLGYALIEFPSGTVIYGCIDSSAYNYNIVAFYDDGSCQYSEEVSEIEEEQQNYSISFDGEDTYVNLDNVNMMNPLNDSFSFVTWCKRSNISGIQNIFRKKWDGGLWLRFEQNMNTLSCNLGYKTSDNYLISNLPSWAQDEWGFIGLTYDGSLIQLFFNGEIIASKNYNEGINPSILDFPLLLGAGEMPPNMGGGIEEELYGELDETSFWNTALTQQEIQNYMNCPPTGEEDGLVGYWNFNESIGDTVYDNSVNGNNGIIYGAEFSEDVPENNCNESENNQVEEFSNLYQIDGFSYGGFFDGSYYFVSQELASWEEANTICNSSGGYLASIISEEENDFISSLLNLELEDGWMGLTDYLNEGDWVWSNGELYEYNNWANNEPGGTDSENNDENYGLIHISGTWNDGYGLTDHQYIMEIDAIYGCLDSDYYNYNPQANTSDNSCLSYEEFLIDSLQQALSVFETVEEVQDYSMSFDGVDDYINCGSNINISNSFSISSWVYVLPNGANYTIASKREMHQVGNSDYYNGFHFTLENDESGNGDDGLRFVIANNSQGDALKVISPIPYNQWNYVVGVFDAQSSIKLYINGSLADSINTNLTSIGSLANSQDLLIGAVGYSPGILSLNNYMDGHLNEATLWSFPLTQQQIQSYMTCPPTGQEEGLVGYWNFNEGSGDTVYDISGNGNHGIINGAEFSEDVPESYSGCTNANALNFDADALCDNGSCVYGDDLVASLEDENSDLEEDLSMFETLEEEQDYSMSFDGVGDNINIGNQFYPFIDEEISIQFDVKLNSESFEEGVWVFGQNEYETDWFGCRTDHENGGNRLIFRRYKLGISYDVALSFEIELNEFSTIMYTHKKDDFAKVYVNGILVGSENCFLNPMPLYPADFWISGDSLDVSSPSSFNGLIDNFIIWDYALTEAEVEMFNLCLPTGNEEGIVGFWDFNEVSLNMIYDKSILGSEGTLYGTQQSEDVPEIFSG